MCHTMTTDKFFVFMFITASYAKGAHGCLYKDASLKFIIRTRFMPLISFYDLHIQHFVTVRVDVLYEVLALLKIEWLKRLQDSCVDNSKAACTYPNDQNYCLSLHIILMKAILCKKCVFQNVVCAISKITNSRK